MVSMSGGGRESGGMGGDIVRVLIVEDDPACTDLYAWYLRGDSEYRYEPIIVDNGADAIAACRDNPPDCAILDFHLPDTTGLELLARLGDGAGTVPFAVVMVSAHASTELATAALSAGALDCLDKTRVTETGLRRAVRTALERSRLRAQIEAQRREVLEQGSRTRQILERITDGFFALDRDWRFTYVNPIAEHLFGQGNGSVLGARLPDLFPELADSALFAALAQALARGEPTSFETMFDPRRIWLEVHIYPDAEGLSIYVHDITGRKEVEAERERQLVRGQTLLRMVRGFAAEADPERLVGSIAEEALRLLSGDRVAVARWDVQDGLLRPIATLLANGAAQPATLANPESLEQAVQQRQPVVINHPADGRSRARSRDRAEVAAPLMDESRLIGAIAVTSRNESRRFGLEDAELLEVLAGLAAATIVGHEDARREGVLLSARTAQHEVNNRLSLVRGYGEIIADHPDLPDELQHPANEIVRASTAAADILKKLGRVDALREVAWGPGLRPTLDLTDPPPSR
jgi:PAS domain S-box-containing protein